MDAPCGCPTIWLPTCRDFPHDQIPALNASGDSATASGAPSGGTGESGGEAGGGEGMGAYLNPWQARHAVLICQSVKETNELRFVLVQSLGFRVYY